MRDDVTRAIETLPFDRNLRSPLDPPMSRDEALRILDRPFPCPPPRGIGGSRARSLASALGSLLFDRTVVSILWASVAVGLLTPRVYDLMRLLAR